MSSLIRPQCARLLTRRTLGARPLTRTRTCLEAFCTGHDRPLALKRSSQICRIATIRFYGHLAGGDKPPADGKETSTRPGTPHSPPQPPLASQPSSASTDAAKTAAELGSEKNLTNAEQRRKDLAIIRRLMVNIWPPGDWNTKSRVLLGFGLLVAGKVSNANTIGLLY